MDGVVVVIIIISVVVAGENKKYRITSFKCNQEEEQEDKKKDCRDRAVGRSSQFDTRIEPSGGYIKGQRDWKGCLHPLKTTTVEPGGGG